MCRAHIYEIYLLSYPHTVIKVDISTHTDHSRSETKLSNLPQGTIGPGSALYLPIDIEVEGNHNTRTSEWAIPRINAIDFDQSTLDWKINIFRRDFVRYRTSSSVMHTFTDINHTWLGRFITPRGVVRGCVK